MKRFINYPGSKWRAAPMISQLMPEHHSYLEPFFGSGGVFFNKEPAPIETVNDVDGEIVNFFTVIRENPEELAAMIETTPYARQVYDDAHKIEVHSKIYRAYKFAVVSAMSFGFKTNTKTGFKIDCGGRENSYAVKAWNALPEAVMQAATRLKNTQIENRPALDLIRRFNRDNVLMYLDPPYLLSTRNARGQYRHEMTDTDHEELLQAVIHSRAKVMLSGYESPMYDDALKDWNRFEWNTYAQNATKRTECLWCNFEPKYIGGADNVD